MRLSMETLLLLSAEGDDDASNAAMFFDFCEDVLAVNGQIVMLTIF